MSPPPGFTWHPYVNGPALYFGKVAVAMIAALDSGRCRVEINPSTPERRSEFFADEATAMAYVDAWARQWQDRLRERYTRLLTVQR